MAETEPRYFTLEEANAVVEIIRPLLREALEIRPKILALQPEVLPVIEKTPGNGGSRSASRAYREVSRLEELLLQIQATGARLKDLNSGLVDFLSLREGREIYLCWQYGEARIEYWHDLEAGFAGRRRI